MSDTDSIKTFPILEKDLRDIPIARLLGCGAGSAAASLGRIRLCPPDVIQGIDVQQNVQWYAKRGDNADIIQVAWRNPCRRNLACQCYGQDLVGKMLEIVQETRRFLVITGGGLFC